VAANAHLTSGTQMRTTASQAARHGTVTTQADANTDPRPSRRRVLEKDSTGKLVVTRGSWTRYKDCARQSGVYSDPNLLHLLPFSNLPQQCRPDEMHQFRGGLMQHLMSAMMSRYTVTLHPDWARRRDASGDTVPGVEGMRRVWERLGQRIQNSGVGLAPFVQRSFTRAFEGRETHGDHVFKMRLTGAEVEALFRLLPLCLPNLVMPEIANLNRAVPSGALQCTDPSDTLILLLGDFLNWYMSMTGHNLDDLTLDTLFADAGLLLQRMHDELPARHVKVPGRAAAQQAQDKPTQVSDGSDAGSAAVDMDWASFMESILPSSSDDDCDWQPSTDPSASEHSDPEDSRDSDMDEDRAVTREHSGACPEVLRHSVDPGTGTGKSAWGIPKARNMYHCPESVRLYGPLYNTSTETLERKHGQVDPLRMPFKLNMLYWRNVLNMQYLQYEFNMPYWCNAVNMPYLLSEFHMPHPCNTFNMPYF